jgi:hypothetical protein
MFLIYAMWIHSLNNFDITDAVAALKTKATIRYNHGFLQSKKSFLCAGI